jgi:hypothetical protein
MFDGLGLYLYSNKTVFMGNYSKDQKHGPGVLKQPNNTILQPIEFIYDQLKQ